MKVTTVIVTFNSLRKNWIYKCLDALMESNYKTEIIIIDNNSTDDTCNIIKEKYPEVILIENKENRGFGQANNQGFEYGLKNGTDYFFLLNQDAHVETATIKTLVGQSLKNREYGILSPIHFNYNGSDLEYYFSIFMDRRKTPYFYADRIKNRIKNVYETKFVNAAAWLLPKKTILEVGGFDPMFFHYGEDDNYCQRVLFHGYKVGILSGSYIYHDSNARRKESNYFYSEKYLQDIDTNCKANYGNINVEIDNFYKNEKKAIYFKIIMDIISLKFKNIPIYSRELEVIEKSFDLINKSRIINKKKGTNYLKF